jgi:hypothetical protein
MLDDWRTNHENPHKAAPGTLELTLRTHSNGNITPGVWNDSGHDYVGPGSRKSFKSRRRATRHGKKLLAAAKASGVNREVIERVIIDTDVFERHVGVGGE